jgi:hypothetical protein
MTKTLRALYFNAFLSLNEWQSIYWAQNKVDQLFGILNLDHWILFVIWILGFVISIISNLGLKY